MTNHLRINCDLARAIGYGPMQIKADHRNFVLVTSGGSDWNEFDYRDETVAFRIAERYDIFPYQNDRGEWECQGNAPEQDTAQAAIALTAIYFGQRGELE